MTERRFVVKKLEPCARCQGETGRKCFLCRGAGYVPMNPSEPVSVLVWQDAKTPPAHGDLVLLAFRSGDGVIGVHIARYILDLRLWVTAYTVSVADPIAYAELTIPPELAEVTP